MLFLAALVFLTRCEFHDWWYYRELREVEARLEAIPNVEIIHSGGNEDLTFEDIYVELNVHGKGRLWLTQLSTGAFTGEQRFFVARIGNLEPQSTFYGYAPGVVESATGKPVKSVGYGGACPASTSGLEQKKRLQMSRVFTRRIFGAERSDRSPVRVG